MRHPLARDGSYAASGHVDNREEKHERISQGLRRNGGWHLAGDVDPASAACGKVSITEMNWASSQVITEVSKFLMEQGYGCTVEKVPSATTTAVASLAENGEPDIVTELWLNSTGDVYAKLEAEGKVERLADVFDPGGVEGWWVPD